MIHRIILSLITIKDVSTADLHKIYQHSQYNFNAIQQWTLNDFKNIFKKDKASYIFKQLHIHLHHNIFEMISHTVKMIFFDEKAYPQSLLALYDFPFVLFYRGKLEHLQHNNLLAIIGSRQPSEYSSIVLKQFFQDFYKYQPMIISGLAYGVDSLAHRFAIQHQLGTIGVLAFGHHYIYPKSNAALFHHMAQHECLISEYPPHQPINKYQFVVRNRIIAALANKILVTEAAKKSGTQLTIDFALDLGKDIYCIPGNINSKLSETPNNYIKEGAIIVTSVEDIF